MLILGTDVRPYERSPVTEVTCPKQYQVLAASKTHTLTDHNTEQGYLPRDKPPINGREVDLEGSVPHMRNRYFSFNLIFELSSKLIIKDQTLVHEKQNNEKQPKQDTKHNKNKNRSKTIASKTKRN